MLFFRKIENRALFWKNILEYIPILFALSEQAPLEATIEQSIEENSSEEEVPQKTKKGGKKPKERADEEESENESEAGSQLEQVVQKLAKQTKEKSQSGPSTSTPRPRWKKPLPIKEGIWLMAHDTKKRLKKEERKHGVIEDVNALSSTSSSISPPPLPKSPDSIFRSIVVSIHINCME